MGKPANVAQTTKQVGEDRWLGFNFAPELETEETFTITSVQITPLNNVAEVAPLTSSSHTVVGHVGKALFSAGTNGETYLIMMKILSSTGQKLFCPGLIFVQDVVVPA